MTAGSPRRGLPDSRSTLIRIPVIADDTGGGVACNCSRIVRVADEADAHQKLATLGPSPEMTRVASLAGCHQKTLVELSTKDRMTEGPTLVTYAGIPGARS